MRPIQQELTGKLFDDGDRAALWIAMEEDGISAEKLPRPSSSTLRALCARIIPAATPHFSPPSSSMIGVTKFVDGSSTPGYVAKGTSIHGRTVWLRSPRTRNAALCARNRNQRALLLLCLQRKQAETSAGCLVHDIVIADKTAAAAELIKTPDYVTVPLRSARVHWHRLPLNLLAKQPLPI